MNWAKTIYLVIGISLIILAMAGCSKSGVSSTVASSTSATTSVSSPTENAPQGEREFAPVMDLAVAAAKLGISEEQLRDALSNDTQKPPDLAAAAGKLGITEEALREALGFKEGTLPERMPPAGIPPTGTPPPRNP